MYKWIARPLVAAAVLAAPVMFSTQAYAGTAQQAAAPIRKVAPERHPEIRRAITALERAKTDLKRANHDFGGHRAEALEACDRAIAQLKLALQYDKN
ncbi:MAG TPA: hypothetical protein VGG76_13525 [Gemmatimonadaceae bacterium]